jgi:hypothetical protein
MSEIIFSTQQTIALDAIAAGASITRAAAEAGVHRNTIANWRRETVGFQLALCNAQYDRALLFREEAEELTDQAFATLHAILADLTASPSVRLKAALAVVNLVTTQVPPQKKHPVQIEDTLLVPRRNTAASERTPQAHNLHNSAQPEIPTPTPAVQTIRRDQPKTGRNEPCPCGSGLKHKRCCLDKPLTAAAA